MNALKIIIKMSNIFLLLIVLMNSRAFGHIPFFLESSRQNIHVNHFTKPNSMMPCANFYDYSCSKWKAEAIKPDFELSWNHFTAASYQIKNKVQFILNSGLKDGYPSLYKAKTFYNACIHFEIHEAQYLTDLRMLITYFKGWPIAEDNNWSSTAYDWLEEIALITKKLGFHPIVKFHIGIDYKNTDNYVLYIEPGSLIFPPNILLNPSHFSMELSAYEEWISQSIHHVFPRKSNSSNFKGEVRKIIDFEAKLAKFISVKPKMERNTLEYFSKKFNVYLFKVVKILFPKLEEKIKYSDTIVIRNYGYLKNLMVFMKIIGSRKVANYLIWTIVKEFSRDTTIHLKKLNFFIDKTVLGVTADISRDIECTNKATDYFSFAILPKYLDLYLKNDAITPIQEMAKNIKSEYVSLLEQNTWLSNQTKMLAIEKVKNIRSIVGYSEWMNNKTELEQYYNEMTITNHHFKNIILIKQLKMEKNLLLFGTTVKTPMWPSNIFDVNAYYSILQNLVFIPLGIIQEPFYHKNGPRTFNYGALGSLIGHEFSHSLDTTGRQANFNGKIEKWWPKEDISRFQLKSKCFNFNEHQVTNILSVGENIADTVGLDISYRAYKKLKNVDSEDIFQYFANEKIFFFSYSQMWCEISDQLDLFRDEHTLVEVRVNQAVQNNHQFQEIFKCSKNLSKTNICKLW